MQSIIIPHRNRHKHLHWCLWGIRRSARICGRDDYEIIVVEHGSDVPPNGPEMAGVRLLVDPRPMGLFNKPRLQNLGIEQASGDVLTFLDADALVGRRFMDAVDRLSNEATITRLCYRVRYLAADKLDCIAEAPDPGVQLDAYFEQYDDAHHSAGFEGYGQPEWNRQFTAELKPIFGNSQFSVRRDDLGDLRYNEEYAGRGYEDLWLIRAIWRKFGEDYVGEMVTDAQHAMFHVQHGYGKDWHDREQNRANHKRYHESQRGG